MSHNDAAQVSDLGLATVADRATLGRFCGTLEYLAPEQLTGAKYGGAVDLWALGCTAYECLVGRSPFAAATTREIFSGILHGDPDLASIDDADARACLRGLLAKAQQNRLGAAKPEELFDANFFSPVDWRRLSARDLPPPLPADGAPAFAPNVVTPDSTVNSNDEPPKAPSRASHLAAWRTAPARVGAGSTTFYPELARINSGDDGDGDDGESPLFRRSSLDDNDLDCIADLDDDPPLAPVGDPDRRTPFADRSRPSILVDLDAPDTGSDQDDSPTSPPVYAPVSCSHRGGGRRATPWRRPARTRGRELWL